ncbi:MAG TPA: F0F1 ATP synthase subunit A [Croceibacterium sp.]
MPAGAKIDPMHQFTIAPIGSDQLAATPFQFTNSALWMLIVFAVIVVFMLGGTKRQLVPGRWQMAVEYLTGFLDNVTTQSIGPEGRKYLPWVFTAFTFILVANWIGAMPFGIVPAAHPFTVTSQFTVTGTMSIISFAIVLGVGFWKHGLKFFTLFTPHGTPKPLLPAIFVVEMISFLVRPFSLGLRPFIAMFAGHILLDVFGNFVVQGIGSHTALGYGVSALAFAFVMFVGALELLVGAIQAFVFALLTALYINDAVNLH